MPGRADGAGSGAVLAGDESSGLKMRNLRVQEPEGVKGQRWSVARGTCHLGAQDHDPGRFLHRRRAGPHIHLPRQAQEIGAAARCQHGQRGSRS